MSVPRIKIGDDSPAVKEVRIGNKLASAIILGHGVYANTPTLVYSQYTASPFIVDIRENGWKPASFVHDGNHTIPYIYYLHIDGSTGKIADGEAKKWETSGILPNIPDPAYFQEVDVPIDIRALLRTNAKISCTMILQDVEVKTKQNNVAETATPKNVSNTIYRATLFQDSAQTSNDNLASGMPPGNWSIIGGSHTYINGTEDGSPQTRELVIELAKDTTKIYYNVMRIATRITGITSDSWHDLIIQKITFKYKIIYPTDLKTIE